MQEAFPLTLSEILHAANAKLLGSDSFLETQPSSVCFDSREVKNQAVFIAHKGEQVDGHDYIASAIQAGAIAILGHDLNKLRELSAQFPKMSFFVSSDLLKSVQSMAQAVRRRFYGPVAAITGAVGKTTTKDLIATILGSVAPIVATPLNDNNFWGVPKTLLKLRPKHRAAVIELGTNSLDELGVLPQICEPNLALVTAIGPTHLEGFGDIEGVVRAETEHLEWMSRNVPLSKFIVNADDPHLSAYMQKHAETLNQGGMLYKFSKRANSNCEVRLTECHALGFESRFGYRFSYVTPWGSGSAILPIPGEFNVSNALAAIALSLSTELITPEQIEKALLSPQITARRAEIFKSPLGTIVYNDSYNASPLAVTSILNETKVIRQNSAAGIKRVVAVLGDMLELGRDAARYHKDVGANAFAAGIDTLLAFGPHAQDFVSGYCSKGASDGHSFENKEELWRKLEDLIKQSPNSTLIVVKGSRGMRMWEIADKLR